MFTTLGTIDNGKRIVSNKDNDENRTEGGGGWPCIDAYVTSEASATRRGSASHTISDITADYDDNNKRQYIDIASISERRSHR